MKQFKAKLAKAKTQNEIGMLIIIISSPLVLWGVWNNFFALWWHAPMMNYWIAFGICFLIDCVIGSIRTDLRRITFTLLDGYIEVKEYESKEEGDEPTNTTWAA